MLNTLAFAFLAFVAPPGHAATEGAVSPADLQRSSPTSERTAPNVSPDIQDDKRTDLEHWNVSKKGLALEGYDPVAYFPEHGGKATKGSEKIEATHRGVTYRFATEANKQAFLKSPSSFEPQYGGWCAWAMADGKGDKVDVDPESFMVENGKLYLFYDGFFGDTRKKWNKGGGAPKLAANADSNWARLIKPKPKK